MGDVYVLCNNICNIARTIKKPEDYTAPKLSKNKLHYMAEER